MRAVSLGGGDSQGEHQDLPEVREWDLKGTHRCLPGVAGWAQLSIVAVNTFASSFATRGAAVW